MFNIKDFRASIDTRGVLRNNKYLVSFNLPEYLTERKDKRYGLDDQKLMTLRCDAVTIPGFDFLNTDGPPRFGYGPIERMPYVPGFAPMNLTFILDAKTRVYELLYDWTSAIVQFDGKGGTNLKNGLTRFAYEVGYKAKYQTDLIIDVYDGVKSESSSVAGNLVMSMTAYSAFPAGLPPMQMGWESTDISKIQVPFSYTDFTVTHKR